MRPALALLALLALGPACARSESAALPELRLGMAPRDVRARFRPGGEGTWQTALGRADETVLEWTSRDPGTAVARARFEFHLGMLVAIRARTREPARREDVIATSRTVTIKAPSTEGGTDVTVLARDCPTHRDEAEAFAARAR